MSQSSVQEGSTEDAVFSSKKSKLFSNKRVNIVLDDLNFLLWKQQILLAVRSHRLEKFLTGKVKAPPEMVTDEDGETVENEEYELFIAQDSALASWLLSTISPHLLPQFVGAESASEIWTTVTKFFASRSTTTIMSLHYKLKSLKKGDLSMRTYISQIKEVCDSLAACGNPISEIEKIATILNGLPMDYKPFVDVITSSREPFTLDGVVSVLVDAEVQQNAFNQTDNFFGSISVAQNTYERSTTKNEAYKGNQQPYRQQFYNSSGRGRGRNRPQCQLCGKIGHLVSSCWYRFDQGFQGVGSQDRSSEVKNETGSANMHDGDVNTTGFVCSCAGHGSNEGQGKTQAGVNASGQWFIDSGATHHVTPDATKVGQGSEYAGPGKITVGDGTNLSISTIGKTHLSTDKKSLILNDLMHVPMITKNLISVSKLAKDNSVFIEFHAYKCLVRDEETGAILLRGKETEGLYKFDSVAGSSNSEDIVNTKREINVTNGATSNYELWHRRLGHVSHEMLQKACKDHGIVLARWFSDELLVVPELHKFSTNDVLRRDITDEHSCQEGAEGAAAVHEEGSNSRHNIDEGPGRSRVEEAALGDTAAEDHGGLLNIGDLSVPEDDSHTENLERIEDDSAEMYNGVHEDETNNSHEVDTSIEEAEEGSNAEMECRVLMVHLRGTIQCGAVHGNPDAPTSVATARPCADDGARSACSDLRWPDNCDQVHIRKCPTGESVGVDELGLTFHPKQSVVPLQSKAKMIVDSSSESSSDSSSVPDQSFGPTNRSRSNCIGEDEVDRPMVKWVDVVARHMQEKMSLGDKAGKDIPQMHYQNGELDPVTGPEGREAHSCKTPADKVMDRGE
ncbi:hypothetical protein GQ457_06G022460 [Hibiscus cannabinus]